MSTQKKKWLIYYFFWGFVLACSGTSAKKHVLNPDAVVGLWQYAHIEFGPLAPKGEEKKRATHNNKVYITCIKCCMIDGIEWRGQETRGDLHGVPF